MAETSHVARWHLPTTAILAFFDLSVTSLGTLGAWDIALWFGLTTFMAADGFVTVRYGNLSLLYLVYVQIEQN